MRTLDRSLVQDLDLMSGFQNHCGICSAYLVLSVRKIRLNRQNAFALDRGPILAAAGAVG